MGHAEMLLAVAGLSGNDVANVTRRLNSGDWSSFAPADRVALHAVWQLTHDPASFGASDRALLQRTFGAERATDVIWHVAWANYMTRFADAFQLPLERENVFARPATDG